MQKMGWFGAVRGHSGSAAMPPFDRAHTTSYSTLIKNHVSILHRFRDIAGYLSKVADFDSPDEFRGDLWLQKIRCTGLSCGVICVIVRLAILVEHRVVKDRQTDRRTDTVPWIIPHSIAVINVVFLYTRMKSAVPNT